MASSLEDKLGKLVELAVVSPREAPPPSDRGIVVVYAPDQELEFRQHFRICVQTLAARGLPHTVLDVERLPFELLSNENHLEETFRLELEDPSGLRKHLAEWLPLALKKALHNVAVDLPLGAYIILENPASLFPWVKYADVLSELPTGFPCYVVIPFPGHEEGAYLHFLDHRDGYNYLARRID
jgi:hypothetical protein